MNSWTDGCLCWIFRVNLLRVRSMAFFVLRYEWVRVYMFKNGIQSYQGTSPMIIR